MKKLTKIKGYIWAFLIPIFFLVLWLFANNILGTKTNTVVVSDMYHQYMVLFGHLKEMLNDGSIFYSFNKGLGGNMAGTIAYYLLSPFNFITLFFNQANMHYACLILVLIKLGLCGTTMFAFLKSSFKKLNIIPLLMFSTCYALTLYNIGYYFNVMWLDGVLMAPLVLLGIDKIIVGKKPAFYAVTLFITIFTNYYIGYIICLFSVIYFVYKLFINYKWSVDKSIMLKTSATFIITSLLAGFMTMFVLLPMVLELAETARSVGSAFTRKFTMNFDILSLISEFFLGISRKKTFLNPDTFYLYSGVINFILMIFYFFNKKISLKERLLSLGVLSIFFISFACNYINYIWHGMAVPNSFNGRFTFLFALYNIYLSCQAFIHIEGVKKVTYYAVAPIFPIIGLIIYIRGLIDIQYVYISAGLYFLYLVLLYFISHREAKDKKLCIIMLSMVVISELFFNAYADLSHYNLLKQKMLNGQYNDYNELTNYIKNQDDNLFYRMEYDTHIINNDPFYFDYYGASLFLSMINENMSEFYTKSGCFAKEANLNYRCSNYMLDALLNIKYVGYQERTDDNYKLLYQKDVNIGEGLLYGFYQEKMNMYLNPYALSLGFMANKDIISFNNEYSKRDNNSLSFLNTIYQLMNDNHNSLLKPIELKKKDDFSYSFKVDSTKSLYMAINYTKLNLGQNIKVQLNDEWIEDKIYSQYYNFLFKNVFEKGKEVTVTISLGQDKESIPEPYLYYFDMDAFKNIIEELKQEQLTLTINNEAYLKGEIDVTSDKKVLFTSIPYESGWEVYVDGKLTPHYSLINTFIGLDLDKGHHIVEFKFSPPGLKTGLIISGISFLLLVLYITYFKRINNHLFINKEKCEIK